MKGWKYDTYRTRIKSDQCIGGVGGRNSCTKWREGVLALILITSQYCLGGSVKMLCKCGELVAKVC